MKIYFDGGCRPNPGMMETAVVVRGQLHVRQEVGAGSSEQAEWLALLHALEVARATGEHDILLLGDAAGVIDQAANRAKCRCAELRVLRDRFMEEAALFDRVRVRHVKRSQNLAGIALGQLRQGRRIGAKARLGASE
ncbi:MAG: reverse transcriptase-like protein [Pseudomonadota bacterium]|nr:reverse transcriptase-like protein [Pseudomonadota bacterium]